MSKKKHFLTLALLMVFAFSLFAVPSFVFSAHAATDELNFDNTDVLDDLRSSTSNGKAFNINDYPFDATGLTKTPSIIAFIEYCYSHIRNMQDNYGLYVYFYNPQGLKLNTETVQNKIQMAVSWDSEGAPNDFETFNLSFCNMSTDDDYYGLFYKFKVVDRKSADGKTILERVNSNERRYDLTCVYLTEKGAQTAKAYAIGGTFKFTGYASGYGPNEDAPSTLACSVNEMETVSLQVYSTNFRTNTSSAGRGHQNELNSIYFSVPDSLFEKYGKLQKIKAEWYEYKTTPIFVTSDSNVYSGLQPFLGVYIGRQNSDVPYSLYDSYQKLVDGAGHYNSYGTVYNAIGARADKGVTHSIEQMNYLFSTNGQAIANYEVTSDVLTDYIYKYNKSYTKGKIHKDISADLFEDGVDGGRTRGYNLVDIDSDNTFNMLSYDSTHSGWQRFWTFFGNWGIKTDGDYYGVKPIVEIADSDITGSESDIASRLLINKANAAQFKKFVQDEKKGHRKTVLFRFAQTDYASTEMITYNNKAGKNLGKCSYMAQETVFLDFTIIQLTFNRDGVYKVIPVVSNPIDIINGITPPLQDETKIWWILLLIIIVIIILLLVLLPVAPSLVVGILKLVWRIISFPFKLIWKLLKAIFKKRGKDSG